MENKNWRKENGRINVYQCADCNFMITTVDIDEGVTPFGIGCPECDGSAHSSMYPNCRPIPKHIPEPTFEFFKPKNNAEIKKYSKAELKEVEDKSKDIDINWLFKANKEHCNQGGLLMRKRTSAKIMLHDDEYTEEHE